MVSDSSVRNEFEETLLFGNGTVPFGLKIASGCTDNKMFGVAATDYVTDDLYDGNAKPVDTWFGSIFKTANQPWIH
jgi:hypothetical protein